MVIGLAREAHDRGEGHSPMPPMMGWALAHDPPEPEVPGGYNLERVDQDWMNEWQAKGLFDNALGLPVQAHRRFRNKFAFVAFDASGEPAAVAGAYDSAGPLEIGVDVAPAHQGRGLAPLVVTATTRDILAEGATPYYACAVTNIRSQRTALASGFLPACSVAVAMPSDMGLD
jgi:RimJ/RimL family protein N-acetyltransferase